MNTYDDKLEELLLAKEYEDLSASEKKYVRKSLGAGGPGDTPEAYAAAVDPAEAYAPVDPAEAYAAARALRLRSRSLLASEAAPADPAGLAAVMERTRPRRAIVIPLWQAAAAVVLVALLAWWGRGLGQLGQTDGLLATVDTVYQEVKVVDTIYLPGQNMDNRNNPKSVRPKSYSNDGPVRNRTTDSDPSGNRTPNLNPSKNSTPNRGIAQSPAQENPTASDKIAEALALLPNPGITSRSGGSQPGTGFWPTEMDAHSDKFSLGN